MDAEGDPPGVGQFIIALDPNAFAGEGFASRMAAMAANVTLEDGVRLPGDRRLTARAAARRHGLKLAPGLHRELLQLKDVTRG